MSQPPDYEITTDFSEEEADGVSGRSTLRNAALDAELANIATSINALVTNIGLIQRDDGQLRDGIVSLASLSAAVLAFLTAAGGTIRGPWLTATAYAVKDVVTEGTGTYICATAHTSGVFATDLAAGKWLLIFDTTNYMAANISFAPTGGVAATNVQDAIAEVDSEAAKKAANLGDLANAATARTNLSVSSKAELQLWSTTAALATGTGAAMVAAFTPAITTLAGANNLTVLVEAIAANSITTPTFTPNSGVVAVKTIVKLNNQALQLGDIAGAGHRLILSYDESLDVWVLLNPVITGAVVQTKGANLVAAATLALGSDGDLFDIASGSGDITAFSSKTAGTRITLRTQVAVTFIHSSDIVLQDGAPYATEVGDVISFRSLGGTWIEESRREIPARFKVGVKLALSQLAR